METKVYEKPVFEVLVLEADDVVRTSDVPDNPGAADGIDPTAL